MNMNMNMNKKSLTHAIKHLTLIAALPLSASCFAGWSVVGNQVIDANGNPFVFRGATIDHTRAPEKTLQAIKDIAALGANAVQVEINGDLYDTAAMITGEQLRAIIDTCKASKVICVLEPNDVAGYPAFAGAGIPSIAADFWTWSGIREAIAGQQDYIILGFGNQALSPMPPYEYVARMQTYLSSFSQSPLRDFAIMIDGNGWSQDQNKAMLEFARQRLNGGQSLPALIYSVDMFDAYLTPAAVQEYLAGFAQLGAPLLIGGFGPAPYVHPHNTSPRPTVIYDLPEQAVMQYAQQYGAGYLGWSWSGNQDSALDLVTSWNPTNLTPWGQTLFNDVNGIKATAKPASIFSSANSASSTSSRSSSSSSSSTNTPPIANITYSLDYVGCGQTYGNVSASGSYDPDGDALTYAWEISGYGGTRTSTEPTLRFYMQPPHYYTIKLTVTDDKGASTTTSTLRNHTYSDNCISSASHSSSSIIRPSSSSVPSAISSSSLRPSSSSSSRSSSSSIALGNCSYVINSQWNNGFTAAIRIRNTGAQPINGWSVNWQYGDASRVTNLWNATLSGNNPYAAKNLGWNATIQPGQTIEFGFQGSKPNGAALIPKVTGSICQ